MTSLKQTIADLDYDEVTIADGFDAAAIGIVERCGQPPIVIYDYFKAASILVRRDKMTFEEACEWLDFNSVGAWVGPGTPGWMMVRLKNGAAVHVR